MTAYVNRGIELQMRVFDAEQAARLDLAPLARLLRYCELEEGGRRLVLLLTNTFDRGQSRGLQLGIEAEAYTEPRPNARLFGKKRAIPVDSCCRVARYFLRDKVFLPIS